MMLSADDDQYNVSFMLEFKEEKVAYSLLKRIDGKFARHSLVLGRKYNFLSLDGVPGSD
jgi:hypothetical protein